MFLFGDYPNPSIDEAMQEAKGRWPEFVQVFSNRRAGQVVLVKAPFREAEADDGEGMWIQVSSLIDETAIEKLVNHPVNVTSSRKGDAAHAPASAIGDWIYHDGANAIGGFTDAVLRHSPSGAK